MWDSMMGTPTPVYQDINFLASIAFALIACALAFVLFGSKKNIDPKKFIKYPLLSKKELSPRVVVATYGLPDKSKPLGLPAGRHIQARFTNTDGEVVMRSYTPSEWRENGKFDILFKVYPKGKMTNHMKDLPIGDTIEIRGPTGRMTYQGNGTVEVANFRGGAKSNTYSSLVLLCGGSGLTPMLQIAKAALDEKSDNTPIYMLFANSTPKDAFYVQELEDLQAQYPEQFKLTLGVSRNPSRAPWKHFVGRFNSIAMKEFLGSGMLPKVDDNVGTAICGPPSFEKAMAAAIKEIGYNKKVKTMRW